MSWPWDSASGYGLRPQNRKLIEVRFDLFGVYSALRFLTIILGASEQDTRGASSKRDLVADTSRHSLAFSSSSVAQK